MRETGHTLVEVLVALVVSSLAIAALATTSRAALRAGTDALRLDTAGRIAASALEERLARPADTLGTGQEDETVAAEGATFVRRVRVSPGPRPDLWRIEVSVRDGKGVAARLEALRRVPWRPAR